jgi:hypothetical protein
LGLKPLLPQACANAHFAPYAFAAAGGNCPSPPSEPSVGLPVIFSSVFGTPRDFSAALPFPTDFNAAAIPPELIAARVSQALSRKSQPPIPPESQAPRGIKRAVKMPQKSQSQVISPRRQTFRQIASAAVCAVLP